jgi:hypothetical protein
MWRAVPVLLLSLLLSSCGPNPGQELTKQVLVSAHTARSGVSHLAMRYEEILEPDGRGPGAPAPGWEEVAVFRASAEARVARELLSGYTTPVPVDPAFERARDIGEVSVATAELVKLALEPSGTWEGFAKELQARRSRLDRAVSALEAGTKSYVLIEARTETNKKSSIYADALARAKATDAAGSGKATSAP